VLSPIVFAIGLYVNGIICKLSASGRGCHVAGIYVRVLLYADDCCCSHLDAVIYVERLCRCIDVDVKDILMQAMRIVTSLPISTRITP